MAEEKPDEEKKKKIKVDQDICIGCGGCVGVAPEYFALNDEGKSHPIKAYDPKDAALIKEAADACPVQAISIEE